MKLHGFGLENFRIFKENTLFDFAPITLLIGPNNSGKSSLIKGLLLLQNTNLSHYRSVYETNDIHGLGLVIHHLNFGNPLLNLVGLQNIRNNEAEGVSFSVPLESSFFKKNLWVRVKFGQEALKSGKQSDEEKFCLYEVIFDNNVVLYRRSLDSIYFDIKLFFEMLKDGDVLERELKESKIKLDKYQMIVENGKIVGSKQLDALNYFYSDFDKILYQNSIDTFSKEINFNLRYDPTIPYGKAWLSNLFEQNSLPIDITEHLLSLINITKHPDEYRPELFRVGMFYLPSLKGFQRRSFRTNEDDILNRLIDSLEEDYDIGDGKGGIFIKSKKNDFIRKWESEFKLAGKISWQENATLGVSFIDINGKSLVDMGFGISQLVAILLSIYKMSPSAISEIDPPESNNSLFVFEEPEANLHPAFQSKLADMFSNALNTFGHQFIIETHSEYMVRKFQYLVAKGEIKKEDVVIYYFNDPNNIPAGEPQVKKIEILEDGSLSDNFGSGFFDEAANWELELLRLKRNKIRQN